MPDNAALQRWQEKLEYLQAQRAKTANPSLRFDLDKEIEEAESKMAELSTANPGGSCHNLPLPSIGDHFKGREDLLKRLSQNDGGVQVLVQKQALHGLGGIGKTRLALEYAWRSGERYSKRFFVTADAPASLNRGLAALADINLLNLPEHEAAEDVTVTAVLTWLQKNGDWLLILDNVDDADAVVAVQALLSQLDDANHAGGHVLVTSRRPKWGKSLSRLDIDVLAEDDAVRFLLGAQDDDNEENARELAKELGFFPLALEQAAAFIDRHEISIAEYLKSWRAERAVVLDWHDEELMEYPASVATTWQKSFEKLGSRSRAVLRLLSHFSTEPIAIEMFENEDLLNEAIASLVANESLHNDDRVLREIWAELVAYSLVKKDGDTVSVHRLVQEVVRSRIPELLCGEWLDFSIRLLGDFGPEEAYDSRTWPIWEPLHSHAARAIVLAERGKASVDTARLMSVFSTLLYSKGLFAEAEPFMRRALEIDESVYGSDHPEVSIDLNNLAQLLQATNRLDEAEPLIRRALSSDEASYGHDHPRVAIRLNNLAHLLQATSRLDEAEPLMRRALEIDEKSYDSEHPDVAIRLNNLAALLQATDRLDEAEPLMRRALSIDEESYGSDHPRVAIDLNNLARLLQAKNRSDEAEPLMRRAVEIFETRLGRGHPNTQTARKNLALMIGEDS